MQELVQHPQAVSVANVDAEIINEMSCSQVRETLDQLFGGDRTLERTRPHIKHLLFEHLESCRKCCRAFDVRVRFRPAHRGGLY